ncbi:MAG: carboxypeptidase regulatory-like domain-containing protein [Acidobacteria bacterium]|nr:MAG: carboxypeptidase regulatory-like domain-containing protein [Acidobacteriota bacterium]
MRRCGFFLLGILLGSGMPASAQDHGILIGTLHDSETARPVAGATVRIMSLEFDKAFTVHTNRRGQFAHAGLPPGRYLVTITKATYAPVDIFDVDIVRGEITRLRVKMTLSAHAPFKRQLIRYRRPLLNTEDASIKMVYPIRR